MQVAAKFKVDIEWPMNDLFDYASITPDVSNIYPNLITPWSDKAYCVHTSHTRFHPPQTNRGDTQPENEGENWSKIHVDSRFYDT
jgi:hypothetical protein